MFLVLPTQLYDLSIFLVELKKDIIKDPKKDPVIVLWECPWYFNNPKYNFNKKKIILHKASMEYYYDYLSDYFKRNKKENVKIIKVTYDQNINDIIKGEYSMFDTIDDPSLLGLPNSTKQKCTMCVSPNFLITREGYEKYRKKTNKFFFSPFYMFFKKELNILPGIVSQDKENRKTLTKKGYDALKIPKVPELSAVDKKYIAIGVKYVKDNFAGNYGNTDGFMFPVCHATVKKWLKFFIKYKFGNFGNYQDVINKDNETMFHSLLSTSINIGLINPSDIIKAFKSVKIDAVGLNNYEGFIRQLFWREYQRYTYIYFYSLPGNTKLNHFKNTGQLTSKWYTGDLGIPPVDDAIKTGFNAGYLHHIIRLMVMGNFMNLSGILPQQGFKWFMEFSCDSYEWVMCQNVYGMAFFADGGKTMRRPYLSSSNYIRKMSNYPKGDWCKIWDDLYHSFSSKKH